MRIQVFPDDLIILKLIPWSILRQISASRFNKLIMARLLEVIFRVHCSYGHDINSFLDSKKDVFCPRFFFSTYVIVTTPFVVQSKKSSGTIQARLWTATTTNNLVIVLGPWFSPGNFDKKTAKLDKIRKLTTIVPHETPINSGYGVHLRIFLYLRWAPCPKSIRKSRSTTVLTLALLSIFAVLLLPPKSAEISWTN